MGMVFRKPRIKSLRTTYASNHFGANASLATGCYPYSSISVTERHAKQWATADTYTHPHTQEQVHTPSKRHRHRRIHPTITLAQDWKSSLQTIFQCSKHACMTTLQFNRLSSPTLSHKSHPNLNDPRLNCSNYSRSWQLLDLLRCITMMHQR